MMLNGKLEARVPLRCSLLSFWILGNEFGHIFQCCGYNSCCPVCPRFQPLLCGVALRSSDHSTSRRIDLVHLSISTVSVPQHFRLTAIAIQLRYSIPGNTGVVRLGTILTG